MNNSLYQLIIKGERIELPLNFQVAITRKAILFDEIDKLQASLTTSFDIPKTAKNKRILNFPEAVGSDTMTNEYDAKLYKGTYLIVNGKAIISDNGNNYNITLYFDNYDIFTRLSKI